MALQRQTNDGSRLGRCPMTAWQEFVFVLGAGVGIGVAVTFAVALWIVTHPVKGGGK